MGNSANTEKVKTSTSSTNYTGSRQTAYDHLFKLLMIGDSNTGKNTLLLRFSDDSFTTSFITTIGVDFKIKTVEIDGKRVKLQIWDTAGQQRFRTITTAYFRGAMGIMLVYNVQNEQSFLNIRIWIKLVDKEAADDVQMILVGHLVDDVDDEYDENNRIVTYERGQELADEYNIPFMEARAKTDINVRDAFMCLAEHVYKIKRNPQYVIKHIGKKNDMNKDEMKKTNYDDNKNDDVIKQNEKIKKLMDNADIKCNKCNKQILSEDWTNNNVEQIGYGTKWKHRVCDKKMNMQLLDNNDIKEESNIIVNDAKILDDNKENQMQHDDDDDVSLMSGPLKQLKRFLIDIGFDEYFETFKSNECDISYIEVFDDETLMNDIGIKSKLKRKKFLKEIDVFKNEMNEFNKIMIENHVSLIISKKLKKHGIVTIDILCNEIQQKTDIMDKFQINNALQCDILWKIIQSQLNPQIDVDQNDEYQNEGIQNNKNTETNTPYI